MPGLENLPDRIEVSQTAEIGMGPAHYPQNILRDGDLAPTAFPTASPLSFSLYSNSTREGSLGDQVAPDS